MIATPGAMERLSGRRCCPQAVILYLPRQTPLSLFFVLPQFPTGSQRAAQKEHEQEDQCDAAAHVYTLSVVGSDHLADAGRATRDEFFG